jgi:signal transduction histidine kinase/ActR/RegA family two-component response regulator
MTLGSKILRQRIVAAAALVIAITVVVTMADLIQHFMQTGRISDNRPANAVILSLIVATPFSWVFIGLYLNTLRTREELTKALADAKAALAVKTDFLANMSHELRTPLNAIIGFSGILKDAPDLDPRHARQVGIIWEGSLDLLRVINDVLDFSRLEAGAVEFDAHAFDPIGMAKSTVNLLCDQATAKGLTMTVAAEGPSELLFGDEGRLRQVLINFLSNAIKFTGAGEIAVSLRQTRIGESRQLRIAVTDAGIGIAPEQISLIFDRFSQADASVSRRYGGSGLGLAISKRIIEGLGGSIGVTSVLGGGSTFWFELSLPQADPAEPAARDTHQPQSFSDRLQLLIVDDNAVNRELIRTLLEPLDIQITLATDGVEAVNAAANDTFDLILMDVQMPNMDGLTATRHIRSATGPDQPRVPIIAITANVLPDQIQRCLDAGMDGHIGKPINPQALISAISETLAERPDSLSHSSTA